MDFALLERLNSMVLWSTAGKSQESRQSPWQVLWHNAFPSSFLTHWWGKGCWKDDGRCGTVPRKASRESANAHSASQGLDSPSSSPSDFQRLGHPAPVGCPSLHSLAVSWHFQAPTVPGPGRGSQYETHSFTIWGAGRGKGLLHHHRSKVGLKLNTSKAQHSVYEAEPWGSSMGQG